MCLVCSPFFTLEAADFASPFFTLEASDFASPVPQSVPWPVFIFVFFWFLFNGWRKKTEGNFSVFRCGLVDNVRRKRPSFSFFFWGRHGAGDKLETPE